MGPKSPKGRLSRPPHPVLLELLYEPQLVADREHVLPYLLRVDAAHLIMLEGCGLLPRATAAALLRTNRALEEARRARDPLFEGGGEHRGLYSLYEEELIARLGPEVGGAAHLARSRNDINATVVRLRLRSALLDVCDHLDELFRVFHETASRHVETLACAFTHQQPAQPTSFGHYLSAALAELLRCGQWLDQSWERADRCPLGSAAGLGTTLAIDPARTARLLGFTRGVENSLDGVASRDFLVHCLAGLAMLGVSLTRPASDLQTWAGQPFRFVGWPDDLVSTSSIMPQKRNPYVLENIRGLAVQPTGGLMNTLMGLKNVPLSNSVEVSGEATHHVWPALETTSRAVRLLALLVRHMTVDTVAMAAFLRGKQTTLTALANRLVTDRGIAFRTAHNAVGRLVTEGLREESPPAALADRLAALLREMGYAGEPLGAAEIADTLDPAKILEASAGGGGPAPAGVRAQLEVLGAEIEALRTTTAQRRRHLDSSEQELQTTIDRLIQNP